MTSVSNFSNTRVAPVTLAGNNSRRRRRGIGRIIVVPRQARHKEAKLRVSHEQFLPNCRCCRFKQYTAIWSIREANCVSPMQHSILSVRNCCKYKFVANALQNMSQQQSTASSSSFSFCTISLVSSLSLSPSPQLV